MVRLIVIILIAAAAFWCYNNVDFSSIANNTKETIKKEKTIKAVTETRQYNQSQEQAVLDNNY